MPEVTQSIRDPDSSELPASARAMLKKLRPALWSTHTLRTVVHHEDSFLATDPSKLKKAAHDVNHTWLAAKSHAFPIAFIATWEGTSFNGAKVRDPYGMPKELYFDYKPDANDIKRKKDEPDWAWERRVARVKSAAIERDAEYNDGVSYLMKQYLIGPKGQFDTWLNGWVDILESKEQAA